jgi:methylmalonyl-CoA mutase, N-terminal domain
MAKKSSLTPKRNKSAKNSKIMTQLPQLIEQQFKNWTSTMLDNSNQASIEARYTSSGYEIPNIFLPLENDFDESAFLEKIGFPGQFPYTRGIHPTMYRGRPWTIRQYAGFGTAKETNERYKYLLSQGTTGLSVAFDLPTQMGRDSDDPLAMGEVGRVGVCIDSLLDMEILFDGIPLDKISTSMTINATAAILLAFYLALAKKRGISWNQVSGTIQNDILKEYVARGTYIYPPKESVRLVTDIFEFCSKHVPGWNTISVSGYHIREAGSTAAQEIGFTFANAITYVEAACKKGLEVDNFAPRIAFFFNSHNNFFEEIAKFRAARRLWAHIMRERFKAKNPRACMLRFHTQTAGSTLTAGQARNNIVRTTLQALAAVLGGTQSLHTNAFDEALCLPTEESALIALRTQQILACESGVADFVDSLGGSFAIEQLTDDIEQRAKHYIDRIDKMGGMIEAISAGFPQGEIEEAAYRFQQDVESKKQAIVGVNVFTDNIIDTSGVLENDEDRVLKVDSHLEQGQIKQLRELKQSRDNYLCKKSLEELDKAIVTGENVMPLLCEAALRYVTVGEISNVFRRHFGEYARTTL